MERRESNGGTIIDYSTADAGVANGNRGLLGSAFSDVVVVTNGEGGQQCAMLRNGLGCRSLFFLKKEDH